MLVALFMQRTYCWSQIYINMWHMYISVDTLIPFQWNFKQTMVHKTKNPVHKTKKPVQQIISELLYCLGIGIVVVCIFPPLSGGNIQNNCDVFHVRMNDVFNLDFLVLLLTRRWKYFKLKRILWKPRNYK